MWLVSSVAKICSCNCRLAVVRKSHSTAGWHRCVPVANLPQRSHPLERRGCTHPVGPVYHSSPDRHRANGLSDTGWEMLDHRRDFYKTANSSSSSERYLNQRWLKEAPAVNTTMERWMRLDLLVSCRWFESPVGDEGESKEDGWDLRKARGPHQLCSTFCRRGRQDRNVHRVDRGPTTTDRSIHSLTCSQGSYLKFTTVGCFEGSKSVPAISVECSGIQSTIRPNEQSFAMLLIVEQIARVFLQQRGSFLIVDGWTSITYAIISRIRLVQQHFSCTGWCCVSSHTDRHGMNTILIRVDRWLLSFLKRHRGHCLLVGCRDSQSTGCFNNDQTNKQKQNTWNIVSLFKSTLSSRIYHYLR